MKEVGAVQSSKQQKLRDFLAKASLDFSRMVSTVSAEPGQQTSGPCPDPESQQSSKDDQSTAMQYYKD